MNFYAVYTDGSCLGNPGRGGWGVVITSSQKEKMTLYFGGFDANTTNNRMELTAAINALKFLLESGIYNFRLFSDSRYVVDGYNSWMKNWAKKGWKGVKNLDLWKEIYELSQREKISHIHFEWVKGHSTNTYNNIADLIATSYAKNDL